MGNDIGSLFGTLGVLFRPGTNVGIGDLSGPVGIFTVVSQATAQGFVSVLMIAAFLSINLGVINLLPFPALDGGRLVFLGYEAVTRKKVPKKVEGIINLAGFVLLMGLMILVFYNDIVRLMV
jgi:regulator of sigma E protease